MACQFMSFATNELIENSNTGLTLTSDITVTGSKHTAITPGWESLFCISQINNEITFGIDQTMHQIDPAYRYRVVFDLGWEEIVSGVLVPNSITGIELTLNYDPDMAYQDKEVYAFSGGLKVSLTNIQLQESTDGGVTYVPVAVDRENLFLKASVETEYYDVFAYGTIPSDAMSIVSDGTDWTVTWPTLSGADHYDLEWTWINRYEGTEAGGDPVLLPPSAVSYDFRDNASRVRVAGNEYSIPMVYGDGFLLVRYRGVGSIPTYCGVDIDGVWTTDGLWGYADNGMVSDFASSCRITAVAHEDNAMNYSALMSFVEEGKRNTGITYSDGILKPRQSVSQLNSQEELIVSSALYDYYGRPAIGVMGSPVGESDLGYIDNLNMLNPTTPYDKSVFHSDGAMWEDCAPKAAPPMSSEHSVGSAKYYSSSNPNQTGVEAFVPEANGYNFSQVHYTNDPTGRVRRAGGVGPDHQLDADGHYTEVLYDMPGDDEVDELLGSEAADVVNYTKVITKDVHGQISVTILDNMGRTVISHLEGTAPAGLEAIEGNGTETLINADLVGLTSEDSELLDQGILQVEKKIAVTDPSQIYTFNYDFTSLQYTECLPPGVCFDCLYEVEFTVTPAEGEFTALCPLTDGTDVIESSWTHVVGNILEFDITCGDPITFSAEHPGTFTLQFPRFGEYYVKKTLKVSQEPIEYYWDAMVENADEECLIPYSEFLADAMMDIDFGDCYDGSPCEMNFYYEYGTWEEYSLETGEIDEAVYDALKEAYITDCENQPICARMRPILLADVSPGGQYGDVSGASGLSVFNSADPMLYSWRDASFYEIDGITLATTTNMSGDVVLVNDATISLTEFLMLWKDWWAEELIGAHPEYETYQFCELYSSTFDYALDFKLTETYADALAAGYITPVNPASYPGCFSGSPATFTVEDPLVTLINGALNVTLNSNLYIYDDGYAGYTTNTYYDACQYMLGTSSGSTLYEMASALSDGAPFGSSTCDLDAQWVAFRDLYLARRNIVLQVAMEGRAMTYDACVQCIAYSAPVCVGSCDDHYGKQKRFVMFDQMMMYPLIQILTDPDPAILTDMEAEAVADIDDYCASACESMADDWMYELSGCVPIGETWEPGQPTYDAVRADLITVCQGGCSSEYPFPSQHHNDPPSLELSSFEQVIINHLGYETMECNHYLVDNPPAVENHSVIPKLNTCGCDKLLHAPDEASFESLYGFVPTNFCADRATCADIAGVPLGGTYLPGSIGWTPALIVLLAAETTLTDYGCDGDGCIECADLYLAITDFLTDFPTASIEEDPVLFTSYVNEMFGTAFDYYSLITFKSVCDSLSGGGIITEGLNPEASQLVEFMNMQIPGGINSDVSGVQNHPYITFPLLLDHTPYAEMGDGGHYAYYGLPSVTGTSFEFTITANSMLVCPQHGFNITPESMGGYTGIASLFANIISFGTIYVTPADITAPGYQFHVTGLVNDPAGGEPITIEFVYETACIDAVGDLDKLCDDYIINPEDDCMDALVASAEMNANAAYGHYLTEMKEQFIANYIETCRQVDETYNYNYMANKYHYTLMYYDRAGNLVKTVPPKGIAPLSGPEIDDVQAFRAGTGGAEHINAHTFVTNYYYNGLNQPVETITPDGGSSKFWYDHLARLVVSQNARQTELTTNVIIGDPFGSGDATQAWSYTQFDDLGRPVEMGEFVQPTLLTKAIVKAPSAFNDWLFEESSPGMDRYRNQVTRIGYSSPTSPTALTAFGLEGQGDIRNRVSSASIVEGYVFMEPGWSFPTPDYVNHYAYDVHGNVRSHLQENTVLIADGRQFFQTNYEYDLLSGLPHYAHFQQGKVDQFSHHYLYDDDNRLKEVYTSKDGHIWDRDVEYKYRLDGVLARTQLGDLQVQGCDFAYTLQGWIKGMNSSVLDPLKDMGKDGRQLTGSLSSLSSTVAQDALAYTLDYYEGDYQAIDTDPLNQFLASTTGSYKTDLNDLFNGNIAGVTTAMMDLDENPLDVTGTAYRYDQLHRFKESHVHTASDITELNSFINAARQNMTTSGSHTLGDYEVHVDYDPNGNITALDRRAYTFGATTNLMDQFTYDDAVLPYETNNHLDHVVDAVVGTAYDDIKNGQLADNYQYHGDGSLKSDEQEEIGYLEWYPNGKLKRVWRDAGTDPDLYFEYDPNGVRILKVEMPRDMAGVILPEALWTKTWYGIDVNGISRVVYQKTESEPNLHRSEAIVYGSKRHGLDTRQTLVSGATGTHHQRVIGEKMYELGDHLGNVKEVITDRKILLDDSYSLDDFVEDYPCGTVGSWFMNQYPGTTYTLSDVNGDGETDLTTEHPTSTSFLAMQTISTEVGETYTVSYDIVSQTVPWVRGRAKQCSGGGPLGAHNAATPGSYSYSFVATTVKSRIMWYGQGSPGGEFTLANIVIDGPGDIYGELDSDGIAYLPDVVSYTDYYPYGMAMPGRKGSVDDYRYAFNGMEHDSELSGNGNSYTTMFRQYDPRLGRWKSVDPMANIAPGWTPYRIAFDNPMLFTDPSGLFEKRKEARRYKKSKGIKGRVRKRKKGVGFTIDDKKNDRSYYKESNLDGVNVLGMNEDGVCVVNLVSEKHSRKAKIERRNQVLRADGIPEDYNKNSGYHYTNADLKLRRELMKNLDDPMARAILTDEGDGYAHSLVENGPGGNPQWREEFDWTMNTTVEGIAYILLFVDGVVMIEAIGGTTVASSMITKSGTTTNRGVNVVYHSLKNGETQYVGITNSFVRRSGEHASRFVIEPIVQGLTRADARAVEQALIEIHKLGKNGGTLLNKINSISPSNPIYSEAVERGMSILRSIGYL